MKCKGKAFIWGLWLGSRRKGLPTCCRVEQRAARFPQAGPQGSEVSCTHTGSRQQSYAWGGAGNRKDIWGRANLHVGLVQSLCIWGGLSLGGDGSQEGNKCRSPWRHENHAEITLSTQCQAAVRKHTSVRRWPTRDRQEEGGGGFQGRLRDAVSTAPNAAGSSAPIYLLPLLLSHLENCQPSMGFSQKKKSKFSNWQKLICGVIWITLNHNIHSQQHTV